AASLYIAEAAVVGVPATSMTSFQATGMPSRAPRGSPFRYRAALRLASSLARSYVRHVKTDASPRDSTRSMKYSVSSSASISPRASSPLKAAADKSDKSVDIANCRLLALSEWRQHGFNPTL